MPVMRQTGPMQRWRKYARGGVGMRGLGQAGCLAYDDEGDCTQYSSDSGTSVNLFPGGSLPSNPLANPVVTTPIQITSSPVPSSLTTGYLSTDPGYIAGATTEPSTAGLLNPNSQLSAATQTQIAALAPTTPVTSVPGLSSAQQAALIAAGLTTAGQIVKSGFAPTVLPLNPIAVTTSTNPFASISATTWLIGAAALIAVLALSGKKR